MSTYKVQDNSTNGVGPVVQLLQHFIPYAQKQLGFHKPVMISFDSDADNATKMLGRTGQYNPDDFLDRTGFGTSCAITRILTFHTSTKPTS